MASVVAVNRQRQVYESTVLHALGTRTKVVMRSVVFEYVLLAILLSAFSMIVGGTLSAGSLWAAMVVAVGASSFCLFAGALSRLERLQRYCLNEELN